jgi:hypothetical protein
MMFGRSTFRLIVRGCLLMLVGSARALRSIRSPYKGPHKPRTHYSYDRTRTRAVRSAEPRDSSNA